MLTLLVHAVTGHYAAPGETPLLATRRTYPICPPSTMAGFLESLAGEPCGSFRASGSKVAYGWARRPRGRASMLRTQHVQADGGLGPNNEALRPILRECLFDMHYGVAVTGPWEEKIRASLAGNISRFGVLSLGDSDDMVNMVREGSAPTEWLVPGSETYLPTRAARGTHNIQSEGQTFDLAPQTLEVPATAWLEAGGNQ